VTKPKTKTSSRRKRPPPGDIRPVTETGMQEVVMDAWEKTKEVIEATAADGTMAEASGAASVPAMLAFLHEHEDLARAPFGSGFMACLHLAASIRAPEGPPPADDPLHGAGHHRTVGRA
jgi:hypothetical protein